jgi:hypothetical protein
MVLGNLLLLALETERLRQCICAAVIGTGERTKREHFFFLCSFCAEKKRTEKKKKNERTVSFPVGLAFFERCLRVEFNQLDPRVFGSNVRANDAVVVSWIPNNDLLQHGEPKKFDARKRKIEPCEVTSVPVVVATNVT